MGATIKRGDGVQVKLNKDSLKYVDAQDAPTRKRFKKAFVDLSKDPPDGDIEPLEGRPPFMRLRVGGFRVIFYEDCGILRVIKIAPRGQAYNH